MVTTVKTQAELDAAIKSGASSIDIVGGGFQVTARGNSQVTAWENSQVTARDNSQVTASKHVAVTRGSVYVMISGGVVIDVAEAKSTPEKWCEYYGVEIKDGVAVLYKGVDDKYKSNFNAFPYLPGTTPVAPDWDGDRMRCGGGLHFSAHPQLALSYNPSATKFVACSVRVEGMVLLDDKVKAIGCASPVWEVDKNGVRITPAEPVSKPKRTVATN